MVTKKAERALERRENMRGGSGAAALLHASGELPARMRTFTEMRLEPGASVGFHMHEGETEIYLFLEGKGRAMDDDREVFVEAGDSMATFSGHGHSVENVGDGDLVLVAAIVLD